jgi:surface protein
MYRMFKDAKKFNKPLNKWNTGNVEDMSYMFDAAEEFDQELKDWDTAKATTMRGMFQTASNYKNHDLSGWDVTLVTNHQAFHFGTGGGNTEPKWK